MILDTSALIAILFGEDDAEIYANAISAAEMYRVSAATFVEVAIVVESDRAGTWTTAELCATTQVASCRAICRAALR